MTVDSKYDDIELLFTGDNYDQAVIATQDGNVFTFINAYGDELRN